MRRFLFFLILLFIPLLLLAQAAGGQVKRPVKPQVNKVKLVVKPQRKETVLRADPLYQGQTKRNLQPIVIFGRGKSTIDAAQYTSLEMVAKYMNNHPEVIIVIRGYTCKMGDKAKNQKLSELRAATVKQAMINRYKIDTNRLIANGMGETDQWSDESDFNNVVMFFIQ